MKRNKNWDLDSVIDEANGDRSFADLLMEDLGKSTRKSGTRKSGTRKSGRCIIVDGHDYGKDFVSASEYLGRPEGSGYDVYHWPSRKAFANRVSFYFVE